MPQKNKKGGNKARGQKTFKVNAKRELIKSEDPDVEYGKVLSGLGDRRLSVRCYNPHDKKINVRNCHIPGAMKRTRMNPGDYILVALREFETSK